MGPYNSISRKERTDWLKTPEGEKFSQSLKKYASMTDFFGDLEKINFVDLTSSEPSVEDAIEHGRKVLTILAKTSYLDLVFNRETIAEALASVGCIPIELANEKFKPGRSLDSMICATTPSFPLAVYSQVFNAGPEPYARAMRKLLGVTSKESGWAFRWLMVQQMVEQEKNRQPGEE